MWTNLSLCVCVQTLTRGWLCLDTLLWIVGFLSTLFQSKWSCKHWKLSPLRVPFNSSSLWSEWPLHRSVNTWERKMWGFGGTATILRWSRENCHHPWSQHDFWQYLQGGPWTYFLAAIGEWQCLLQGRGLGWLSPCRNHFSPSATFLSIHWGQ